jgi:hypothetical protein
VRASSHVLHLLSIVESTEPKQVYGVKLDFVSERTIKEDHHHPTQDNSEWMMSVMRITAQSKRPGSESSRLLPTSTLTNTYRHER